VFSANEDVNNQTTALSKFIIKYQKQLKLA
jgi:hypothetical protein